ncbi:hypothetical protein [Clostridium sp. FP1]|uniref:hypothetical protein n=1 Tax=Clostridium sp. FP1 TaxID=2724076 RepID=UPI0013E93B74|nr:hypothetical protein [Clostridium sp. FP1]MBZ9635530.1 hypothetical protein [Clostridium sp. FP1]
MVELKGSEKQVKWANDIRNEKLKEYIKELEFETKLQEGTILKSGRNNKMAMQNIEMLKVALNVIENLDDSNYFIRVKDDSVTSIGFTFNYDKRFNNSIK